MAGSVNKVILVGRLGQDPKLTYLPSGQPAAEFTLATDESFKNREGQKEERTEWHRIKVYGKQAEVCANYLGKGRLVYIEGSNKTRSWEQDGQKKYVTEVVVSAPGHCVQFMDSKGGEAHQPHPAARPTPQTRGDDMQSPRFPTSSAGLEDVPFAFMLVPLAGLLAAMMGMGGVA
jgi:single-strand DNA-binding protein